MDQQPHKTAGPEPLWGGSERHTNGPLLRYLDRSLARLGHRCSALCRRWIASHVCGSLVYMTALTPSSVQWGRTHCQLPSRLGNGALNPGPHLPG